MNKRIKQVRKELGLTQEEYASKLGISRGFLAQLETTDTKPSDRTISDICRVYSVNENWLRNGEGEMFLSLTKNQEIAQFLNDVMSEDDEEFRKRFVAALAAMTEDEWAVLAKILTEVTKGLE